MEQRLRILSRLRQLLKLLCWQNTELRMKVVLLEADLKAAQEVSERWQHEAVNWQQVALLAIAKSEATERQLLNLHLRLGEHLN
jgi:hypothetical protein